ncbi:hypothetical protein NT239_12780 [Chitinibacter sp. SCUT-21]|uniref:hypothetical protein n=1 Tax=Chitinibacter sp. SCUT-21 TaxID=2970891 RepID=UPI0035A693CC
MKALKTMLLLVPLTFGLAGCDQLLELVNKPKANGKAIGAACRHSGRSLEDCFRRNAKIPKADIFAGWKEMNEYMQAKKIDVVPPPPDVKTGELSQTEMMKEETEPMASEVASAMASEKPAKEAAKH